METESREQHAKFMSAPKGGGDRKLSLLVTTGKVTDGMCGFSGHLQQGPLLQVGFSREQTGGRSYHAGCLLLGNALQIGGCERKGKTGCPLDCPSLAEMARASGSHLDLSLDLGHPGVAGSWVRSSLQPRHSLKRPTAEGAGGEALPAAAA